MYQEFKEYTSHFNLDESGIKLKFEHSIRVANISKQIATHLKWNNKDIELAFTGRQASEELIKLADYVTEMKMHKHPYQKGVEARKGIEY